MEFVLIKGGTFTMGDLTGTNQFALPTREVTVDDFYMGKYEVTFVQYDQYCTDTGRARPSGGGWGRTGRPVFNVNWHDAVGFTEWLSQKSGKTIRLPSEAEWEYAYRGKTKTAYWWGDQWQTGKGACDGCGSQWDKKRTAPVGSFPPNPFGIYDMTGNVFEWTLDHRHNNYNGAPSDGSPWVETEQLGSRIARGGSWMMNKNELRSADRSWEESSTRFNQVGFRVVMEQ